MIFEEKTIRSELKYEGKILNVRVDEVTSPNGTTMREIVEHRGAVALIPITAEGKVVMVRQFRKAAEEAMLEIPAGKLEAGEDPLEAATRELREETGYTADEVKFLFSYYPCIGYSKEVIHVYLCTGLTAGETDLDEDEAIDCEEYTPKQLIELIENGEIRDGKTIIAAYYLKDR